MNDTHATPQKVIDYMNKQDGITAEPSLSKPGQMISVEGLITRSDLDRIEEEFGWELRSFSTESQALFKPKQ